MCGANGEFSKSVLPANPPRFVCFEPTPICDPFLALLKRSMPHFVRFGAIEINYDNNFIDKVELWTLFDPFLQILQQNNCGPVGAKLKLNCATNRIRNLSTHTLTGHITNQMLPHFANCSSYEFSISSEDSATHFIDSLLKCKPISHSSNIVIGDMFRPTELPVEIIGDWLDRPIKKGQKPGKPNFLCLRVPIILNALEMVKHLKKVSNIIVSIFSIEIQCKY